MKNLPSGDGRVKDEIEYPFVPPGNYWAIYKSHVLFRMYGNAQKLRIWLTISDSGEVFGQTVPMFFNVDVTNWRNRSWTAGTRSKLVRMLCKLFPAYEPRKSKRILVGDLKGKQVRIKVKTVTLDRDAAQLPKKLRYSKVDEVLEIG